MNRCNVKMFLLPYKCIFCDILWCTHQDTRHQPTLRSLLICSPQGAFSELPDFTPYMRYRKKLLLAVTLCWLLFIKISKAISSPHSGLNIFLFFLTEQSSYQWTAEGCVAPGCPWDVALASAAIMMLCVFRPVFFSIQGPTSLWDSGPLVEDDLLFWLWFVKDSEAGGCKNHDVLSSTSIIQYYMGMCVILIRYSDLILFSHWVGRKDSPQNPSVRQN